MTGTQPPNHRVLGRWARFSDAQVLLLGTGAHVPDSDLPAVAAVGRTITDLHRTLAERCGLAPDSVQSLVDPSSPLEMGNAVAAAAERADGRLLLTYFVGHGLVSSDGKLYLATQASRTRLPHTALAYSALRDYLMETAGPRVVILDCCFSGRALDSLGDLEDQVLNLAEIHGGFVLTSSGREEIALAPVGAPHTAFSGALLELLRRGDPDGPAEITLQHVHRYLTRVLPAARFPRPRCRSDGGLEELVLARNPAYRALPPDPRRVEVRPLDERGPLDVCPYKGLPAFDVADAPWFFGRERLTTALADRLAERYDDPGLLIVVGASGSGKSSLLRAGLLPAISRGELGLAGSTSWPRLLFPPTADPIGAFATEISKLHPAPAAELADEIRVDPGRVIAILKRLLEDPETGQHRAEARVVLVIDQFEEIFTQCGDEQDRRRFVRALSAAAGGHHGGSPALVVLGVRADFFAQCAAYPELLPALEDRQVVVGPMATGELRAAIERPAAAAGLVLEAGLVELILSDLGASQEHSDEIAYAAARLPLLSHALLRTWQERQGATLTVAGYRATGGIHGALAATGDQVMATLTETGRETARGLLLRLVRIGDGTEDTRRRVDHHRLIRELPDPDGAARVLQAFAADDARLITLDHGAVEITHEALLRSWPTLRGWIDADRAGLLIAQHLIDAAHVWDQDGRDPAALYRGSRLTLAREWAADQRHGDDLGALAKDFLRESIRHERREQNASRRRTRRLAALSSVLAVLLLISVAAGAFARQQWSTASSERQRAVEQQRVAISRNLAVQADALHDSRPVTALLLGIAAHRLAPDAASRASLLSTKMRDYHTATLAGHTSFVITMAFSSDGRALITGGPDGAILWDARDWAQPRQQPLTNPTQVDLGATAVSLSPDGHLAVAGLATPPLTASSVSIGGSAKTMVWDVRDPSRPRRLATLGGHLRLVTAIEFSPDGHTMVVGGGDTSSASVWAMEDPTHPRRLAILRGHTELVTAVAFSPDGRTLVTGDADASILVWDIEDRKRPRRLASLSGLNGGVAGIAWDPEGQQLIARSFNSLEGDHLIARSHDSMVLMWDVKNRTRPRRLTTVSGKRSGVAAVGFSPNGPIAVSSSSRRDEVATVWSVRDGGRRQLATLSGPLDPPTAVVLSPNGKAVATGSSDGSVRIWDATGLARPRRLTTDGGNGFVETAAFFPEGHTLITGGVPTAKVWDVRNRSRPRQLSTLTGTRGVTVAALSPDGNAVITGNRSDLGGDSTAKVWDVRNRSRPRQLSTLTVPGNDVASLAFSPDGHTLIEGSYPRPSLWDLDNRSRPRMLGSLTGPPAAAEAVAFSPDGTTLVTGNDRNVVRVWAVRDKAVPRPLATLTGHTNRVTAVAFSPDGHTMVSGSEDGTALIWEAEDGRAPRRLAALTSDGNDVASLRFSPDGHAVVTGHQDGTVTVWDVTERQRPRELTTLTGHTQVVSAVAFSSDGRTLVTGGMDGIVNLWDTAGLLRVISHPLDEACAITQRGLNRDEWARYVPGLPYQDTCAP